jgi:structure-specific recognition protein 1
MGATAARTFDLKIITKSGPEYTFTSINKEEHDAIETYLKDKKVRIKNEMVPDTDILMAAGGDDDDDESMQSVVSSGDEAPKPRTGGADSDSEEGWYDILSVSFMFLFYFIGYHRRRLRGVQL